MYYIAYLCGALALMSIILGTLWGFTDNVMFFKSLAVGGIFALLAIATATLSLNKK